MWHGCKPFAYVRRSTIIQQFCHESSTQPNPAPIAYFYCGRNSAKPQRSDPTEVMRAILKQLMCCGSRWQTDSSTAIEYNHRKLDAEEDGSDIAQLDIHGTTQKIIDTVANTRATIFIDALDECCSNQRHYLLSALNLLLNESTHLIKVLISSQDDMDIVMRLQKLSNIYINIGDNGMDVRRYAQIEVEKAIGDGRLLNDQVSTELREHIIESLQGKANGMYEIGQAQLNDTPDNFRVSLGESANPEIVRWPPYQTERRLGA